VPSTTTSVFAGADSNFPPGSAFRIFYACAINAYQGVPLNALPASNILRGMQRGHAPDTVLDDVFRTVDGQTVTDGLSSWRLHVYGIQIAQQRVWVQLAALGSPNFVLTLRLPPSCDGESLLTTIAGYIRHPQNEDEMIGLMACPPQVAKSVDRIQ
jgi:hypothetical protein